MKKETKRILIVKSNTLLKNKIYNGSNTRLFILFCCRQCVSITKALASKKQKPREYWTDRVRFSGSRNHRRIKFAFAFVSTNIFKREHVPTYMTLNNMRSILSRIFYFFIYCTKTCRSMSIKPCEQYLYTNNDIFGYDVSTRIAYWDTDILNMFTSRMNGYRIQKTSHRKI